jgi:hypothetical protein
MDRGVGFSRLVNCLFVGGRRPGDLVISRAVAVDDAAVIDDAGVDPAGMWPQHPAGHLAVHRQ